MMLNYLLKECKLSEKAFTKVLAELPLGVEVAACFNFTDNRVSLYDRKGTELEGLIVVTGPLLGIHAFINRGMTRKYIGEFTFANGVLSAPEPEGHKNMAFVASEPFQALVEDVVDLYPGFVEFFQKRSMVLAQNS